MQMTAAPEGQSSDITESFPLVAVFSSLLHQAFKGLPSIHFRENWGKVYRKRLFEVSSNLCAL